MKVPPYWLQWMDDKASKLAMLGVSIAIGVKFWWLYGVLSFIAIMSAILITNTILLSVDRPDMSFGPFALSRWLWILLPGCIFLL